MNNRYLIAVTDKETGDQFSVTAASYAVFADEQGEYPLVHGKHKVQNVDSAARLMTAMALVVDRMGDELPEEEIEESAQEREKAMLATLEVAEELGINLLERDATEGCDCIRCETIRFAKGE